MASTRTVDSCFELRLPGTAKVHHQKSRGGNEGYGVVTTAEANRQIAKESSPKESRRAAGREKSAAEAGANYFILTCSLRASVRKVNGRSIPNRMDPFPPPPSFQRATDSCFVVRVRAILFNTATALSTVDSFLSVFLSRALSIRSTRSACAYTYKYTRARARAQSRLTRYSRDVE